ncbi:MAG TPA: hypothetical protein PKA39_06260 [Ignavibacteria bacterium]|nr:hypothetical protein [Ignavibacteria bacterium]
MAANGNNDLNFLKYAAIISLILIAAASYPVYKYATEIQIYSFAAGYAISLLNALLGYKLNTMAFGKPTKSFMMLVFGGMGIRLLIVMLILLIILVYSPLDSMSLVGSVFFFYTVFIILEIYFLQKQQAQAKKDNKITPK